MTHSPRKYLPFPAIAAVLECLTLLVVTVSCSTAASAGIPTGSTPVSTVGPTQCPWSWDDMHPPSIQQANLEQGLIGVDALSPNDVWGVGGSGNSGLIVHWDGTQWSSLYGTDILTGGVLSDVSAAAPTDVWAVGRAGLGSSIVHWDGISWSAIDHPTGLVMLSSVYAASADAVWAIGHDTNYQSFALRWDGQVWTLQTLPANVGRFSRVAGTSSTDVWAVGSDTSGSGHVATLHWDGNEWSRVPSEIPGSLFNVTAISPTEAWAVGGNTPPNTGIILHWDGNTWSQVATEPGTIFYGVAATSIGNVWVSDRYSLLKHWNGTSWTTQRRATGGPSAWAVFESDLASPNDLWSVGFLSNGSYSGLTVMRYHEMCPEPVACSTGWATVPSYNPDPDVNMLYGLDARTPSDVWAVGVKGTGPQIQHWDGSSWSLVPGVSPDPGEIVLLQDVAAISADDAWTVGFTYPGNLQRPTETMLRSPMQSPVGTTDSMIYHWNGTAWNLVPNPMVGQNARLFGVDGTASNDVWAVGRYFVGTAQQTLVLHWNGTAWSQVNTPPGILQSVTAISLDDVWAVGYTDTQPHATLTMHWDGSQWSVVPSPNLGTSDNYLESVSAVSSNDVWAVGWYSGGSATLVLHWNGTEWTQSPTPGITASLTGVSARAPNDVWAVGDAGLPGPPILHWDGTSWTAVYGPPPAPTSATIYYDVAAASSNEVWLAGFRGPTPFNSRTLIMSYMATCDPVTPTATATATTTGIATSTPTSTVAATATIPRTPSATPSGITTPDSTPTRTATSAASVTRTSVATPTACTITFSDVPTDNTFYPFVRCLACRGIINGYPDGTFRPNNYVTRGQLAKVVSLSAGFTEPVSGQTFEDVAPGSTFYDYIERLASHEVMGGYQCGIDPAEPCRPGNRPYFRPNAGATRGQLTKIVSNAAAFNDTIPAGQHTFTDVPEGSTFHLYVERLLLNRPGVMSGYTCGGTAEPCDSENRSYFRPGNPLTRGQTAKIVANTFFPECATPGR